MEEMKRREFLKRSGFGTMGLFFGMNMAHAGESADKTVAAKTPGSYVDNWKSPWHPEVPNRLCALTHSLAKQGLSGEWGAKLIKVNWQDMIIQRTQQMV